MKMTKHPLGTLVETDVLVIGSGASGCGAALGARDQGLDVVLMDKGKIMQQGAPEDVYRDPDNIFAAQFIGQSNIIEGVVASAGQGSALVEVCPGNAMVVPGAFQAGERIALSVRAERIDYADKAEYGFTLAGVIKMHSYIGGVLRTTIELPTGQELLITGANPVSKYPAVAAVVERGKAE